MATVTWSNLLERLKEWGVALISKRMPERRRIVRFEIVFSHIPFLLRLSQITEPEPEPYPRPPRIHFKIFRGFRTFFRLPSPHTNPDLHRLIRYDDRCYDICEYPASRAPEQHKQQPDQGRVYVKVFSYTSTYSTEHFACS